MIDDCVFGKLDFDYSWSRNEKISFFGKEIDILFQVEGDEDDEFEEGQYDAYKMLMEKWSDIQEILLESISHYYIHLRKDLGYNIEFNKDYPEINTTEELLNHITLVGVKVQFADLYGGRSILPLTVASLDNQYI